MSRPEITIDWKEANELLMCGAPGTEIAAYFGMHPNTFYRRVEEKYGISFSDYSAEKKSTGEALIRRHQYHKALGITKKGDNTLLIWLGKQRLGQRENPIEALITEEVMKGFAAVMNQLTGLQTGEVPNQLIPSTTPVDLTPSDMLPV